jgi:hypothetical protein
MNISRSRKRYLTLTRLVPTPTPGGDLYRVKRYDEMLDYYNWEMLGIDVGNFGYVQIHVIGLGEGSVTMCTRLTPTEVLKLRDMQIEQTLTKDQIMGKLIYTGKYGQPMWTNDENNDWRTSAEVRNGACVYTNQKVLIDRYATLQAKMPGQSYDTDRRMGRLVCFKPTDWDKTYRTHPWLIHHMTGVNRYNVHHENPHGNEIFIPILDPAHFNLTPMNTSVVKEYWIDMEYVVPV